MLTPPYLERYRALRASTASLHELPRRAVHTVQYEELVAAPAETLQAIADFLEITPAFDVTNHPSRIAVSCCRALLKGVRAQVSTVKPSPRESPIQPEVTAALEEPDTAALARSLTERTRG